MYIKILYFRFCSGTIGMRIDFKIGFYIKEKKIRYISSFYY